MLHFSRTMRFLIGFVIGLILLPAIALLYIRFGYAPVATAAPAFPMERVLAKMALNARITKEEPREAAIPATEETLMGGASVYRDYCAVCHGMSGQPKTPTAKGMYPPPPQLLHGKGVTDDPVGETYWKVKNGIRLTGMPAYGESLSGTQLWQVSQLLKNGDQLPAKVTAFLAEPPPAK